MSILFACDNNNNNRSSAVQPAFTSLPGQAMVSSHKVIGVFIKKTRTREMPPK